MRRDHRATMRADLLLLAFVVVLVAFLAYGALESVRPALEVDLETDVLGDEVERTPETAP